MSASSSAGSVGVGAAATAAKCLATRASVPCRTAELPLVGLVHLRCDHHAGIEVHAPPGLYGRGMRPSCSFVNSMNKLMRMGVPEDTFLPLKCKLTLEYDLRLSETPF